MSQEKKKKKKDEFVDEYDNDDNVVEVPEVPEITEDLFVQEFANLNVENEVVENEVVENEVVPVLDVIEVENPEDNLNNNSMNWCYRPCPPCPQTDCPAVPFECPCTDISCPKKLSPNTMNMQQAEDTVGVETDENVEVKVDVKEDLRVEGVEISIKKPPPDVVVGCPCGDDDCKKKACNQQPTGPRKYDVCEQRYGGMVPQGECDAGPEMCEADFCDEDQNPRECPCLDGNCPGKAGELGFRFVYPETVVYDKDGCPKEQQIECFVKQDGSNPPEVICRRIGKMKLKCTEKAFPPCPCPEYERMEKDSCDCPGNNWGEEIGDEGVCIEVQEEDVVSAVVEVVEDACDSELDDFEWDYWIEDTPCNEEEVEEVEEPKTEAPKPSHCSDFMKKRKETGNPNAVFLKAQQLAVEAFQEEQSRIEKYKASLEARKTRISELRDEGLSDEDIFELLCKAPAPVTGLCAIPGGYPPQEACKDIREDMPGCPCPDPECPKKRPFDSQMLETSALDVQDPEQRAKLEKYWASEQHKSLEREYDNPSYRVLRKTYVTSEHEACPCPKCENSTAAIRERLKMIAEAPNQCPCLDPKCPKKGSENEESERDDTDDAEEDINVADNENLLKDESCHTCSLKGPYPRQSGCYPVVRPDLICNPCGVHKVGNDFVHVIPDENNMCHPCSLRTPFPPQSDCPEYECDDCELVCDDAGCKPPKCAKCQEKELSGGVKESEDGPTDTTPAANLCGIVVPSRNEREEHPKKDDTCKRQT